MDARNRLKILANASRYDLACACGTKDARDHRRRGTDGTWLYPVARPSGGVSIMLKTLMTNACSNDCRYCPLRAGRSMRRYALEPHELLYEEGLLGGAVGVEKGDIVARPLPQAVADEGAKGGDPYPPREKAERLGGVGRQGEVAPRGAQSDLAAGGQFIQGKFEGRVAYLRGEDKLAVSGGRADGEGPRKPPLGSWPFLRRAPKSAWGEQPLSLATITRVLSVSSCSSRACRISPMQASFCITKSA